MDEVASMVRMHQEGSISQRAYDDLRLEWQEKVAHLERCIANMQQHISAYFDDLELALVLLARPTAFYPRLAPEKQHKLIKVLFARNVIDEDGQLLTAELKAPFAYLDALTEGSARERVSASGAGEFYDQLHIEHASFSKNHSPIDLL